MIADDLIDERLDRGFIARVALDVGALEVGPDDGRAFRAEQLGGGLADARSGAGDDGDFAL